MAIAFLVSSPSEIEQFVPIACELAVKMDAPLALLCVEATLEQKTDSGAKEKPKQKNTEANKTKNKTKASREPSVDAKRTNDTGFLNRVDYSQQTQESLAKTVQRLREDQNQRLSLVADVLEIPSEIEEICNWVDAPHYSNQLGRFEIDTVFIPLQRGAGSDERRETKNRLFESLGCESVYFSINHEQTAPLNISNVGYFGASNRDKRVARNFAFRLGTFAAAEFLPKQRDSEIQCVVMAIPGLVAKTRIDNNKTWNDLCRDPNLPLAMIINPADSFYHRFLWRMDEKIRDVFADYQMQREDRERLAAELIQGTTASPEFILFMAIATLLACIGLLQNSPAVIIGAMLVAPLMTPLLGAGLAMIQGNRPLFSAAAKATGIGVCISFVIGMLAGLTALLVPAELFSDSQLRLTDEMISRSHPNLLDPFIGLAGGLAGGFAVGRDKKIGALAGVAIAAALVPPVATAGLEAAIVLAATVRSGSASVLGELIIGDPAPILTVTNLLADGHAATDNVRLILAPMILFFMNACAVVLGSFVGLRLVGMHRTTYPKESKRWVGTVAVWLLLTVILFLMSIPIIAFFAGQTAP